MELEEESQRFTTDSKDSRKRGWRVNCLRTICVSIVTSLCTCCCIAWLVYNIVRSNGICQFEIQNKSISQPFTERLVSREADGETNWYGRFTIQQQLLFDKKNNSSAELSNSLEHYKINWTARSTDRDNANDSSSKLFQTDSHGCVLIPRTGHWLVHSEVTFAYSDKSQDQVWVYMQVNNGTVPVKKTITLPDKQYRGRHAHLPVDLTDVIYFKERDVLCVVVSEWRTVYASEMDNSLTLVYLSMVS